MSEGQFALLFIEGERSGEAVPLTEGEITIGRSRSNRVVLGDELLSRQHIKVRLQGSDIVIEDLDSAHGTFLNGKRLRGIVSLAEGDEVQLGSQKFRVAPMSEVAEQVDQTLMELDAIDRAAEEVDAGPAEEEGDKTRFAAGDEEELDETRYHQPQHRQYQEEEEDAKTRVFEDSATRMLDVDELQGLRPGQEKRGLGAKVIGGIALIALLLVGGTGYVVYEMNKEEVDPNARKRYTDTQHAFSIRYPVIWEKTGSDPQAVIAFELIEADAKVAHLKVYVDQSLAHEIEGLQTGFEKYKEDLAGRHKEFRLIGSKRLAVNDLLLIQYGFSSDRIKGFGLYTHSGPKRFNIETAAAHAAYPGQKAGILKLLESFRLTDKQQVIDFPLPSEEIRNKALADPAGLAAEARQDILLAQDLLAQRKVRTDNLFRSVEQYRLSLTKAAALTQRPAYYEKAARELAEASTMLQKEIEDIRFKVVYAEKAGDYETAQWELSKLLRLVPDKNDPVHLKTQKRLKRYR